jgi:hypothetical protein
LSDAKAADWQSKFQLVMSILAAAGLLVAGGVNVFVGVNLLRGTEVGQTAAVASFMLAVSLLAGSMLVLPSAWYAYRRLRPPDREVVEVHRTIPPWLLSVLAIILIPTALVAGGWVERNSSLAWLLLPGISLVVTGMPILWLVGLGKRGLSAGSRQRQWGLLTGGMVFSPLLSIILEMMALVGVVLVAIIVVAFNPGLLQELSDLATDLETGLVNPEDWQTMLMPYIQRPIFLTGVFAYAAVLIPLIEEALKPLGLWLLVNRRITPAEGFVGGMMCGAGFALFENLIALSTSGEQWALLAGLRISTALLHMLTTGVMGWALASAWTNKRYYRVALSYMFAVSLHGIWNALGIASFTLPQYNLSAVEPGAVEILLGLAVIGLGVLTVINFVIFIGINRKLRPNPEYLTPEVLR